jgi:hypothetical protein
MPNLLAGDLSGKQEVNTFKKVGRTTGSSLAQFGTTSTEEGNFQMRASMFVDGLDELDLDLAAFQLVDKDLLATTSCIDHLVAHDVLTPKKARRVAVGGAGDNRAAARSPGAAGRPAARRFSATTGDASSNVIPHHQQSGTAPTPPRRPNWMRRPTLTAAAKIARPSLISGAEQEHFITPGWANDDGMAQPYATRRQVREWAIPKKKESLVGAPPPLAATDASSSSSSSSSRRDSGINSVSPEFELLEKNMLAGIERPTLPMRPVLADSPAAVKSAGISAGTAAPDDLMELLESISAKMERAGNWEKAARYCTTPSVVAEVQAALDAAHVRRSEVSAPQLLTSLMSCFA